MKRRDQTAAGHPRDGKRTDRARAVTLARKRVRAAKYSPPGKS